MDMNTNSKITPEIKAKLRKILALAESGTDGEKTAAKNRLQALLLEYDLTLEDIAEEEAIVSFKFNGITSKLLNDIWSHCCFQVLQCDEISFKRLGTSRYLKCTKSQAHQITDLFKWHSANFKKELKQAQEDLFLAYILKHHLGDETVNDDKDEADSNTPDKPIDIDRLRRILLYEQTLQDNSYHKSLNPCKL